MPTDATTDVAGPRGVTLEGPPSWALQIDMHEAAEVSSPGGVMTRRFAGMMSQI
jgi:hypothetical protein